MSKKILVIEDEKMLKDIYTKHLRGAGYEVENAESIDEAKRVLKNFSPDLFIMDHGLEGGKSGGDSIPKFKKKFPKAIFILFSNYNDTFLSSIAANAGADYCWVKINITLEKLLQYLEEIFETHK